MIVLVAMLIVLFIFVIVILCFIVLVACFPMTTVALIWYSLCLCCSFIEYAALFVTCLSISMNAVTCSLFVTCWRMLLKGGTEVLAIFVIADLTTLTL